MGSSIDLVRIVALQILGSSALVPESSTSKSISGVEILLGRKVPW